MSTSNDSNRISDSLAKSITATEKLRQTLSPIIEQQHQVQASLAPVIEQQNALRAAIPTIPVSPIPDTTHLLGAKQIITGIGELAIKAALPAYTFESPALRALESYSHALVNGITTGLKLLVDNTAIAQIQAVSSVIGTWLHTVDFSPMVAILKEIQSLGFEHDYDAVNEVFLKAMFDARWFQYAGWIADFTIVDSMLEILDTSRASKNRTKRIDKLIFSYYDKDEINNLKRGWRKLNLPSYMVRILVQSIQAYHRKEYALTISALSTLWEGIIQEKVNDPEYRISKRTRENLSKLIEENEFDKIFNSFCEEFIFYDCRKPEDVKKDVPGRHCIAHCWYDPYPNRKTALNAILFTDFLLHLSPLERND